MKKYEFQKPSWNAGGILSVYPNGEMVMTDSDGKELNFREISADEIARWLKQGTVKEV